MITNAMNYRPNEAYITPKNLSNAPIHITISYIIKQQIIFFDVHRCIKAEITGSLLYAQFLGCSYRTCR